MYPDICQTEYLPSTYSDTNANSDLFLRDMVRGDPEIAAAIAKNNIPMRKRKKEENLKILPLMARPLVKNPEKFKFEDPYESDKDLDKIKVAPIDPKAMDVMDTGKK